MWALRSRVTAETWDLLCRVKFWKIYGETAPWKITEEPFPVESHVGYIFTLWNSSEWQVEQWAGLSCWITQPVSHKLINSFDCFSQTDHKMVVLQIHRCCWRKKKCGVYNAVSLRNVSSSSKWLTRKVPRQGKHGVEIIILSLQKRFTGMQGSCGKIHFTNSSSQWGFWKTHSYRIVLNIFDHIGLSKTASKRKIK